MISYSNSSLIQALLHHTLTFTFCSNLSDQDVMHLHITSQEKTDLMEEVLTEVSVYLGMLYHLIEAFKDHDDFADELSTSFIQYLK
jgi:hypothetical protein